MLLASIRLKNKGFLKGMRFYKKIVTTITIFFAGVSGVFLLSGTGLPVIRVFTALIFFISLLNLSIYIREFGQWSKNVLQKAGKELAASGKSNKKAGPENKADGSAPAKKPNEGGPRRPAEGEGRSEDGRDRDRNRDRD